MLCSIGKTALAICLMGTSVSWANTYWHVSIDVSGLPSRDIQIELALYDNSPTIGDAWALADNVTLGGVIEDFEGGSLGSFDRSLNPASVAVVSGSLNGTGSFVMRLDEDLSVTPTYALRDFLAPTATTLEFDLSFHGSGVAGPYGLDQIVVSLLDPVTLAPLMPGLTPGYADVLAVNATGFDTTENVAVTLVPEPATLALLAALCGFVGVRRRYIIKKRLVAGGDPAVQF
jgi:hypothetical protein